LRYVETTLDHMKSGIRAAGPRDRVTSVVLPELGAVPQDLQQRYADAGARGIADAAPLTCGWIVDLRRNRGGNMYPMLAAVAPLLPDGAGMSFRSVNGELARVMIKDGGVAVGWTTLASTSVRTKVVGQNVAVLYDGHVLRRGGGDLLPGAIRREVVRKPHSRLHVR